MVGLGGSFVDGTPPSPGHHEASAHTYQRLSTAFGCHPERNVLMLKARRRGYAGSCTGHSAEPSPSVAKMPSQTPILRQVVNMLRVPWSGMAWASSMVICVCEPL